MPGVKRGATASSTGVKSNSTSTNVKAKATKTAERSLGYCVRRGV